MRVGASGGGGVCMEGVGGVRVVCERGTVMVHVVVIPIGFF